MMEFGKKRTNNISEMSLIPHSFFPRRMFDMDTWTPSIFSSPFSTSASLTSPLSSSLMSPLTTLDLFDPFDDIDRMMSRNLQWFDRPSSWMSTPPLVSVPQKYRISVDASGFSPESIKTEQKEEGGQRLLTVHGRETTGTKGGDDYLKREIRKTFRLPENIEIDKMASFMTPNGQFIVEFPLRETERTTNLSLLPQIVDTSAGGKQVQMNFPLPQNIDPNKVQVSVKDRDLIMRVEDRQESPDRYSRTHMYTRTTLPEGTDFNQLKCVVDNNQLSVTAPLSQQQRSIGSRNIPLEVRGQQGQQQIQGQQGQQQGGQQQQMSVGQ